MRISLIDDEGWVTDTLAAYLERQYHTVSTLTYVKSEEDFHTYLRDFRPDGVIIDSEMEPRGDLVYQWLRKWRPDIPIVFYTKYADSPDKVETLVNNVGVSHAQIIQKTEIGLDVPSLLDALRSFTAREDPE